MSVYLIATYDAIDHERIESGAAETAQGQALSRSAPESGSVPDQRCPRRVTLA